MQILDLRKEVEELISGQEIASLVASVFPTPEWEGESGVDDNPELSLNDEILPVKNTAATAQSAGSTSSSRHVVEAPATISPPGDEVAAAPSSRINKSHADYESRVSVLRCVLG